MRITSQARIARNVCIPELRYGLPAAAGAAVYSWLLSSVRTTTCTKISTSRLKFIYTPTS